MEGHKGHMIIKTHMEHIYQLLYIHQVNIYTPRGAAASPPPTFGCKYSIHVFLTIAGYLVAPRTPPKQDWVAYAYIK